jgi:hypothetical protein
VEAEGGSLTPWGCSKMSRRSLLTLARGRTSTTSCSHAAAVVNALSPDVHDTYAEVTQEGVRTRVAALEEAAEPLVKSAFAVAYFCPDVARLLVGLISRLANGPSADQGHPVWLGLTRYPASLVLYGAGLGAVAGRREELLGPLRATACVRNQDREVQAIALAVYPQATLDDRLAKLLPDLDRHHTPVSDRVYEVVTPWLADRLLMQLGTHNSTAGSSSLA